MSEHEPENGEPPSSTNDRLTANRLRHEPQVFERVSDRDLVTLADVLCQSLEFYSMLVASKVMAEIGARELWPAVIDRRAYSMCLSALDTSEGDARRLAAEQIQGFRDEHFPIEPAQVDDDVPTGGEWRNGHIAF